MRPVLPHSMTSTTPIFYGRRTQVSLLPPPCDEFTTSEPFLQGHARQPAGQHVDVLAVEDERPQIDVAAFEVVVHEHRHAREREASAGRCSCAGWLESARANVCAVRLASPAGRSACRSRPIRWPA